MAKGLEVGGDSYIGNWSRSGEDDMGEDQDDKLSRRNFLKILGYGAVAAPVVVTAYNCLRYGRQIAATVEAVKNRIALSCRTECLPPGFMVPEDERTGQDILVSVTLNYSPAPVIGGYNFNNGITKCLTSFLQKLPNGTNVYVLASEDFSEKCLSHLKKNHPGLEFTTHNLPFSERGSTFPQDMISATGRKDTKDRLILVASSIEATQFNLLREMQRSQREHRDFSEPLLSLRKIRSLILADEAEVDEAEIGIRAYGDEFLAEKYPEKFALKYVPVATTGGDMQITRLPDGRLALIVGKENLSRTVLSMQLEESPGVNFMALNEVDPEKFEGFLERARETYKLHFGVEEVIFIDEPYIRQQIEVGNRIRHTGLESYKFFHSDMIVKTATCNDGRRVAFCSSQALKEPDSGYLWRIQEQFRRLGYDVKLLECGPFVAMNYTNVIMFMGERGKTIVMLPQYGAPGDEEAAKVYKSCGFEVRKVDMSSLWQLPPKDRMATGSLHCMSVVMS